MAQKGVQLDRETSSCCICLDPLEDPVSHSCGHSYCMDCIKHHWDGEEVHSCPQCRETFSQRPVLLKNTSLSDLVEQLKKTGLQDAEAGSEDVGCDVCTERKLRACKSCLQCVASYCENHLQPHFESAALQKHKLVQPCRELQDNICSRHNEVMKMFCRTDQQSICYLCSLEEHKGHNTVSAAAERTERQRELEGSRLNIQQRIQAREEDVKQLQQEVEAINGSADKAVDESEEMFNQLILLMEKRCSEVKQQVRSKQETEVSRVKEDQEKLEQEISDLKRRDAELKLLSLTEDHNQFLHSYYLLPPLTTPSSSFNTRASTPSSSFNTRASTPSSNIFNQPSTPSSSIFNRPSTPSSNINTRPSTPSSNIFNQPSTPSFNIFTQPSTPSSNIFTQPSTPSFNIFTQPSTPSSNIFTQPSTPSFNIFTQPSTPSFNIFTQPSTPSSNINTRPSTPSSNIFTRASTPSSSINTQPSTPSSNIFNRPSTPSSNIFTRASTPSSSINTQPSTPSSSIFTRPLRYFEDVTAALSALRDKLQDVLRDEWTNISLVLLSPPEPKTRAEFLQYSREITLDPNTAYSGLLLSESNRKATLLSRLQASSIVSNGFTDCCQVLSRESLTGRCYWEVEWRGLGGVSVAVAYKNISRSKGYYSASDQSVFGRNDKSWAFDCNHNDFKCKVVGRRSSRVGVYLDHSAGILSFYSISETMTLLHRVRTTFTQPLHAGVRLYYFHGDTAEFCKLK